MERERERGRERERERGRDEHKVCGALIFLREYTGTRESVRRPYGA